MALVIFRCFKRSSASEVFVYQPPNPIIHQNSNAELQCPAPLTVDVNRYHPLHVCRSTCDAARFICTITGGQTALGELYSPEAVAELDNYGGDVPD